MGWCRAAVGHTECCPSATQRAKPHTARTYRSPHSLSFVHCPGVELALHPKRGCAWRSRPHRVDVEKEERHTSGHQRRSFKPPTVQTAGGVATCARPVPCGCTGVGDEKQSSAFAE